MNFNCFFFVVFDVQLNALTQSSFWNLSSVFLPQMLLRQQAQYPTIPSWVGEAMEIVHPEASGRHRPISWIGSPLFFYIFSFRFYQVLTSSFIHEVPQIVNSTQSVRNGLFHCSLFAIWIFYRNCHKSKSVDIISVSKHSQRGFKIFGSFLASHVCFLKILCCSPSSIYPAATLKLQNCYPQHKKKFLCWSLRGLKPDSYLFFSW